MSGKNLKKILIVDDDPEIVRMIEEMLKMENYEVFSAHDGPHAIEKTNQNKIDLILLDIRMPIFSGLWFCNAFKQKPNTRDIPVVIVSSMLDDETVRKAREIGASDCLQKPFRMEDLLQIVQKNIPA